MTHRGRLVDPAAITDIALLAIEGEKDDISGLGQTKAALTLATKLPDGEEELSTWPKVPAITASSTARSWRDRIAPVVEEWIAANA